MEIENFRASIADRTDRRLKNYEAMFGALPVTAGQTLVNVGAGDSALGNELPGVNVIDVDYGYSKLPPLYNPDTGIQGSYEGTAIAAKASEIPLGDDAADCVVASFLFMHMNESNVARSLDECIRITAPRHKVLIGPVWDRKNVAPGLKSKHVHFRVARYADGWARLLHSMAITIPEDKSELAGLPERIAASRMLGNMPPWRNLFNLARQCLGYCCNGEQANRRFDIGGHLLHLDPLFGEREDLLEPPFIFQPAIDD
ncbi:MAG TPA: class I SAM-dependent methyltransferase [Candidatus Saccharimonadales bacterium]|nr:class I SAM-dependent methyltransferase [Candidatus Saccharimonadales bacterium]